MKNSILLFLLVCSFKVVYAQPRKPQFCTNAPAGFILKDDQLVVSALNSCIPESGTSTQVTFHNGNTRLGYAPLGSAAFFTPVDSATFDINNLGSYTAIPADVDHTETLGAGGFWSILRGSDASGQQILSCAYMEIRNIPTPIFSISSCDVANNRVTVTFPDNATNRSYDQITVFANGAGSIPIIAPTTYPKTLTYPITDAFTDKITVQGVYFPPSGVTTIGNCSSDARILNINQNDSTYIKSVVSYNDGKSAKVAFEDTRPGNNTYKLVLDTGSSVANPPPTNIFNVDGLNPTQQYCFKIISKSTCGLDVPSKNQICTVNLTGVIKDTRTADLAWKLQNSTPTLAPIVTSVKSELFQNGTQIPLPNDYDINYTVTVPDCSNLYTYSVTDTYVFPDPSNPTVSLTATSTSADLTLDFKRNYVPQVPTYFMQASYDVVKLNNVVLKIKTPSSYNGGVLPTYDIYRADGGSSNFQLIGSTTTGIYTDVISNTDIQYCYKYVLVEDCGLKSLMSEPICLINLTEPSTNHVAWTEYKIPSTWYNPPLNYGTYILQYSYDNGVSWYDSSPNTTYEEDISEPIKNAISSTVLFRVKLVQSLDINGYVGLQAFTFYSNTYVYEIRPLVLVPTAFSPISTLPENQVLKIFAKLVDSGKIKIYDRWGEIIFQTDDLLNVFWDGRISNSNSTASNYPGFNFTNNSMAPMGTYPWVIDATGKFGDHVHLRGVVTLIR